MNSAHRRDWFAWSTMPVAAFFLTVVVWGNFRLLPHWEWSACRLAASVRIVYGLPLYTPPHGAAMNDWMYGPVAPLAYLPAALAHEPLLALRIATWLNAIYFLLPLLVLFGGFRHRPGRRWAGAWGFMFCLAALLLPFGTWYGAAVLHVDTVAIGLGVFSCVALVRARQPWLAAVLYVLAVWTKQPEAPLVIAQLVFLVWSQGTRRALDYAKWVMLAGIVATGVFCAWFGPNTLWHNLVVIPSRYPFEFERLGPELISAMSTTWWIWLVALAAWKYEPPSRGEHADADVPLGWLLLLAAILFLPGGIAATIKAGGSQNSLHSLAYGVLGASMLGTALVRSDAARVARLARGAMIVGAFAIIAIKFRRVLTNDYFSPQMSGYEHQEAFDFTLKHPGQTYFPRNPLVSLMAEGRDYPSEVGYRDWLAARDAPPPAEIRRAFPATLVFIIYDESTDPSREMLAVFPDFSAQRVFGRWRIYTRPAKIAPRTPTMN